MRARAHPAAAAAIRAPVLLFDCGNSRLKWALLQTRRGALPRFAARGVIEIARLRRSGAPLTAVLAAAGSRARLVVCNVAGERIERRIRAAVARAHLPAPHFVHTRARGGGVRTLYRQPWRLGVDRWVALIGARHAYPQRALCLASVGSAMTIDLLDAAGTHRGGCIVPGPDMMIDALLTRTAGIRPRAAAHGGAVSLRTRRAASAAKGHGTLFARDTRAALLNGAAYACATLIERAVAEAAQPTARPLREARAGTRRTTRDRSRAPLLIMTGGAAGSVAALLRVPHVRIEDLVLRGLALLARADTKAAPPIA